MYRIQNLDPWKYISSGGDSHSIAITLYYFINKEVSMSYIESVVRLNYRFHILGITYKTRLHTESGLYLVFVETPVHKVLTAGLQASDIFDVINWDTRYLPTDQKLTLRDVKDGLVYKDVLGLRFKVTITKDGFT